MPLQLREGAAERPVARSARARRPAAAARRGAGVDRPAPSGVAPATRRRLRTARRGVRHAACAGRAEAASPAAPMPATGRRRARARRQPRRRRRRRGARRRQRVLDRVPHRLVHLAAVAEAHLDLGRVHVDVDARRVDLDEQHVDRLAVRRAARPRRRCARACAISLVAHVAAVDVDVLLVGARARRVGHAGAARDAQRRRRSCVDGHALRRRSRRRARRPARCSRAGARAIAATSLPSCQTAKPTSGRASAWRRTASTQCASSVASVFRNLRRAGVLKNSSLHLDRGADGARRRRAARRCARRAGRRCAAPARAAGRRSSATEAIAASASPRKPIVADALPGRPARRSCWSRGGCSASGSSSRGDAAAVVLDEISAHAAGQQPHRDLRARRRRARCRPARAPPRPGRSTTSPAAIWLTSSSGSSRIGRRAVAGGAGTCVHGWRIRRDARRSRAG